MCALKTSNSLEAWGGIPALPSACLMHHQMTRTTLMMKQHELGVSWPWFKIVNQKLTERAPEPWDCLSKDSVYLLWMSFVREQRDTVPGTRAVDEKGDLLGGARRRHFSSLFLLSTDLACGPQAETRQSQGGRKMLQEPTLSMSANPHRIPAGPALALGNFSSDPHSFH